MKLKGHTNGAETVTEPFLRAPCTYERLEITEAVVLTKTLFETVERPHLGGGGRFFYALPCSH
jgi:hypothetical protein